MSLVHVGNGFFVDTDRVESPGGDDAAEVYAYAEFRSLEHVEFGLVLTEGGPKGKEIDSVAVGDYGMEPLNPYWEFGDALDAIRRGSEFAFEEIPAVEVETEAQFNEALDALGVSEDDDFVTTWEGPGLYDFRDDPPTRTGSVEDSELEDLERAADDAIDFMFQGDEWENAYRTLVGG